MLLGILDAPVLCISKDIVKDCEQIIRKLPSNVVGSFQCEAIYTNVRCRKEIAF